ncbi:hypothetical protein ATK30_3667 [Amycolatopsis echigonensis]|uniref:Uncharacterized protein n=1 Tax=Amycolatopsis echigonensis TaxID=2576905 RepID=A0A2N3WG34_9PSEU|nr:hypothetical protein [Amycolatopsis niigatensis]PKV92838.1 hypothetical protein ATK30_3667 [Amycolatopsis niigatensis]
MSQPDDLEQRLRALFSDDRLAVEPPEDAASAIVAGARRRRRRQRILTSAAGAACVLAVASAGLVVLQLRTQPAATDVAARQVASAQPTMPSSSVPEPPSSAESTQAPAPVETSAPGTAELPAPPAHPHHTKPAPPQTTPTTKAVSGALVTADGLGAVKLGMTEQQLADQGMKLTAVKESAGCTYYDVSGAGVPAATAVVSQDNGVVAVKPDGTAHTPEGVGDGSPKDQVTATYPGTSESGSALVSPTGDQGAYHFTLNSDGAVQSIEVRAKTQDCAG